MTELANIQISQNHFPKQPQEDEEDYEKLPQITFFHKITFALLGICSQSGWNAILNAFDFFQSKFPKQNFVDVAFYFPIPIMFTNFIISVTLVIIGNIVSIEKSIPFSLKGTVISLVSLSLIGIFLKYTLAGTMSCLTNNLSVALSMATQNGILINIFFTFTSLSGVIMNILRFIALGAFGIEDLDNGTGPAPFFIFIAYVQTFMLFPGVSVFQKPQYTLIKQPYALVFVFTIFNIGDLIANQQGSKDMQNDLFQYFLLFTFALTNGMVTSILMTIAPQRANNAKDRDFISYMSVFFLTFGITVGSFMALIFQKN
ncbi:nucleoside transporter family protein, putative [Ichthyophthirius multifiliis]|uniref:Nucleoside transporter family protein, putative n=1 Tax=Ichthyophthirius multifiliis TaxID=5932 RepID=G0QYF2_ICHMU|nr:nucleoside transporter family protein, putative [Ichthyophthirius multifiliis]EGR29761.1 nucleoside transporter family protein, putative [Ichthyophthirius multifiliis]|eukprot:XP_004030997.1 nucleoside transporter family protein, putative [Ichthyophthirius multifiliis]